MNSTVQGSRSGMMLGPMENTNKNPWGQFLASVKRPKEYLTPKVTPCLPQAGEFVFFTLGNSLLGDVVEIAQN